jgi:hypothetical protein
MLHVEPRAKRKYRAGKLNLCSTCAGPRDMQGQRLCRNCHAAHMRKSRRKYSELSPDQKIKANARSKAKMYLKRGLVNRMPCERCAAHHAEMHHEDYSKPLEVRWLCRKCHLAEHHHHAA